MVNKQTAPADRNLAPSSSCASGVSRRRPFRRFAVSRRVWLCLAIVPLLLAGLWFVGSAAAVEAKARLGQWLLADAWTRTLAGESRVRPWPWADSWPVARLEVPGRGIDLVVLAGATGRSLAWAPGHVSGTAPPAMDGLTIFGGHRDTHFRFLGALSPGEALQVQTPDGRTHAYEVTDTRIVDSRRAVVRRAGAGTALLLVTCYPFDAINPGGPLRYLVHAAPIGQEAAAL